MNLTKQSIQAIANIKDYFDKIEEDFKTLSNEEQETVHEYHAENYGLNHCIRWGLQAAENILEVAKPETGDEEVYEVSDDLETHIEQNMEGTVESHLEEWSDRYYRKSLESAVIDLRVNHDFSDYIERVEEDISRKLTDDEKDYYKEAFIKEVEEVFYL